jgi:hypothetical protein
VENDDVGCCVWCISGVVFHESSNAGLIMEETSSRSRRRCDTFKVLPEAVIFKICKVFVMKKSVK